MNQNTDNSSLYDEDFLRFKPVFNDRLKSSFTTINYRSDDTGRQRLGSNDSKNNSRKLLNEEYFNYFSSLVVDNNSPKFKSLKPKILFMNG